MLTDSAFASLRPASFRGVAFEADDHDKRGGRRLARHEYPLRDIPYAEDLGRKAKSWRINAFYVRRRGADVPARRDELIAALDAAGPGTLIHPWLGEIDVCVDDYSLHESTGEGGYCKFSIDFVEAGFNAEPKAQADTAAGVSAAVDSVAAAAADTVMRAVAAVEETFAAVANAFAVAQHLINLPQTLVAEVLGRAAGLINTPAILAGLVFGMARMGFGLPGGSAFAALFATGNAPGRFGAAGTLPASFPDAPQSILSGVPPASFTAGACSPADEARRLTATALVAAAAEDFARAEFRAADDALSARDILVEALDIAAETAPDALYAPLCDLRAAVVKDAAARAAKLPRIRRVTLPGTVPALVAAYRIHGAANREGEIVARNKIRHPGFVPGGTALEVLSL